MGYMLDTNICVFILRDRITPGLRSRLLDTPLAEMCLSAVTLAELEFGVERSRDPVQAELKLQSFLAPMDILPFDMNDTLVYAKVRHGLESQGTPIGPLDTLIAAHALSRGLVLATNNTREFSRVPGLQLEDWME